MCDCYSVTITIEMMLSLRKIIDPQKIEFIDKVIECYKNGLFK